MDDDQGFFEALERASKELNYGSLLDVAALASSMQAEIDSRQYVWNRPLGLSVVPVKPNALVG
jgi:hypothetical protein